MTSSKREIMAFYRPVPEVRVLGAEGNSRGKTCNVHTYLERSSYHQKCERLGGIKWLIR
ncbi:hypothetical protein M404DRAFT_813118 [Pisolithus tinctorius Marx 270]|uniref:Uncharacterized protein n=1 Tax=Pisolithus tinctorius Marx 270 TaxID=870435 RepID=A0A0C3NW36_PISTI|nr:hypothetical protein M404DRAFT_813118 [Pisolithus tinctorius Marx 270]